MTSVFAASPASFGSLTSTTVPPEDSFSQPPWMNRKSLPQSSKDTGNNQLMTITSSVNITPWDSDEMATPLYSGEYCFISKKEDPHYAARVVMGVDVMNKRLRRFWELYKASSFAKRPLFTIESSSSYMDENLYFMRAGNTSQSLGDDQVCLQYMMQPYITHNWTPHGVVANVNPTMQDFIVKAKNRYSSKAMAISVAHQGVHMEAVNYWRDLPDMQNGANLFFVLTRRFDPVTQSFAEFVVVPYASLTEELGTVETLFSYRDVFGKPQRAQCFKAGDCNFRKDMQGERRAVGDLPQSFRNGILHLNITRPGWHQK